MTGLQSTLAQLPYEEPSWIFGGRDVPGTDAAQAATFLASLEDEDFGLFVLAYGFGMRLGVVSQTLKIEPALVVWRIQRALRRWGHEHEADPALLEPAVTALLRGELEPGVDTPPPPPGRDSWLARELVPALDQGVQARLQAQLETERRGEAQRPGVGIGSLVLIVIAVLGIVIYGAIRDVNPIWRGKALMQKGEYAAARAAFQEALERKIGDVVEAHEQTALCWLAEGDYERALEEMAHPGVLRRFGAFAPRNQRLEQVEVDDDSEALLPRGFVLKSNPSFVFATGPAGRLTLSVTRDDKTFSRSTDLPDTRGSSRHALIIFPEEWSPIPPGSVVDWSIEREGESTQAFFTMAEKVERAEVARAFNRFLTRGVPNRSREFFRGHYYLNRGLYTNAATEFAKLAKRFPGQDYPIAMLQRVASALRVDPEVFLR